MDNAPVQQGFWLLRIGFTVAPIVAGADKFLNLLANWEKYLPPLLPNMLGISPHGFMEIVGVVEIVAGLVVAFKPKFGGLLVGAWLLGIIVNLAIVGGYWDIALRDLGLLLAAVTLSRLATALEPDVAGSRESRRGMTAQPIS
ncbi:MAG: hypothetical protein ABI718_09190 [Acidobacteriota bacterium]